MLHLCLQHLITYLKTYLKTNVLLQGEHKKPPASNRLAGVISESLNFYDTSSGQTSVAILESFSVLSDRFSLCLKTSFIIATILTAWLTFKLFCFLVFPPKKEGHKRIDRTVGIPRETWRLHLEAANSARLCRRGVSS